MGIVYDEVYITTKREIDVCEKAIKRLKKRIASMEKKHGMVTADLVALLESGAMGVTGEFARWYEAYLGIQGWERRILELEETLVNPPV